MARQVRKQEWNQPIAAHRQHAAVRSRMRLPACRAVAPPGGRQVEFPADHFSRRCLLDGVDELGYILRREAAIAAFEAARGGSIGTL